MITTMSVTVTTSASRGPAGWAAIGVLGGASLVGLAWVISSRIPTPATAQAAGAPSATPPAPPAPPVVIVQLPPLPQSLPSDAPQPAGPHALATVQVPNASDQPQVSPADHTPAPVPEAPAGIRRININTASVEELDLLPGVGKATALAIIEHRTKYGHFRTVSDLDKVPGIGPSRIEKLRPLVIVE